MIEEFGHQVNDWIMLKNGTQVHKTALIASWVRFGDDCIVHPYAVVGKMPDYNRALARQSMAAEILIIGSRTSIGCGAVIYGGSKIGEDCLIGDGANVREGVKIGDFCVIGCHVCISYNVKIGNKCRFQNGTVIVGDIHIGDDCFFGTNVTTSNDRNVDLDNYHFPLPPQPSVFGNKIMVGSGSNILAGCKIGDGVIIGAGALVVKDIESDKRYMSEPAKEYIKSPLYGMT